MRSVLACLLGVAATAALVGGAVPTAGELFANDLVVTGTMLVKDRSLTVAGSVLVMPGGSLVLDHANLLLNPTADYAQAIQVFAGGSLTATNGSNIVGRFQSPAARFHYVFVAFMGSALTLRDSTVDGAVGVGVADPSAVIDNVTISNGYYGLYGPEVRATRLRLLDNLVGVWVAGNSSIEGPQVAGGTYIGAVLQGAASLSNGSFFGNLGADIMMFGTSRASDNVHQGSTRGIVANDNATIERSSFVGMSTAAIQLGADPVSYPCVIELDLEARGLFLNLTGLPVYYRANNSVVIQDIEVRGTPVVLAPAASAWRVIDPSQAICPFAPPPRIEGPQLSNHVLWRTTRAQSVVGGSIEMNGTLLVEAGASLLLEGTSFNFASPGPAAQVVVDGGVLSLRGSALNASFVDYTVGISALNWSEGAAPGYDFQVLSGTLSIEDSSLHRLGRRTSLDEDTGIVAAGASGAIEARNSQFIETRRFMSLACCAPASGPAARVESVRIESPEASLVLRGGWFEATNTTFLSGSGLDIVAASGASRVDLRGTRAVFDGPGVVEIHRYGHVRPRAVWLDGFPLGAVEVTVFEAGNATALSSANSNADGWLPFLWLEYWVGAWSGGAQSGGPYRLFDFIGSFAGQQARATSFDPSAFEYVTLQFHDDEPPVLTLDSSDPTFTTFFTTTISLRALDNLSGLYQIQHSTDGQPFITDLKLPRGVTGLVVFSFPAANITFGYHEVTIQAFDSMGNSFRTKVAVVVDTRGPEVWLDVPSVFYVRSRAFNLTGLLTEPGAILYNGHSYPTDAGLRFGVPILLTNDTEVIYFVARDVAGNGAGYSVIVHFDDTPPNLEIVSPSNGTTEGTNYTLIDGRVERNATLVLNGVPLSISGTSAFTLRAGLSPGENLLVLEAVDLAGNVARAELTVYSDPTPPPLTVISPVSGSTLNTNRVSFVLFTEPGANVSIQDLNFSTNDGWAERTLDLEDGYHTIAVSVSDAAGHVVQRTLILLVDTLPPRLFLDGGWQQATPNATLRIVGVSEPYADVVVGGLATRADAGGSFVMELRLHPGQNNIPVESTDLAGNRASSTLVVLSGQPGTVQAAGELSIRAGTWTLLAGAFATLALSVAANRIVDRRARRTA